MERERHGLGEPRSSYRILPTGDPNDQTVEFAADSDLPDDQGTYRDDGYVYARTSRDRVFTRVRAPLPNSWDDPLFSEPPWDVASGVIREHPTLTYRQYLEAADRATREPANYEHFTGGDGKPYDIDEDVRKRCIVNCGEHYFVRAVRFVTRGRPEEMRPRAAVPPDWGVFYNPEDWTREWKHRMWDVAYEHMQGRGTSAASPFISVAANEAALLRSTDWDANSIVFGRPDAAKHAPHIAHLRIPEAMLLSSTNNPAMEEYMKHTRGDLAPLLLFKRETEHLFLGADLTPYVVGWRDNPYRPDDRDHFVGDI